jgi:hypothetical protein
MITFRKIDLIDLDIWHREWIDTLYIWLECIFSPFFSRKNSMDSLAHWLDRCLNISLSRSDTDIDLLFSCDDPIEILSL